MTRARRRGITLIELAGTLVMLTLAMGATTEVVGWLAAEHRASERRSLATQEAANALERLTIRRWDEIASGSETLSEPARRALPDGQLLVGVTEADGLKRIRVEVRWRGPSGTAAAPVRLTAWVGRRGGPR